MKISGGLLTALLIGLPASPDDESGHPIDRHFETYWAVNRITPAPPANDYEFLRRLSLDLTGRLPRPEEIRTFAADRSPEKRLRKIDELLTSDDAARFWGDQWMRALFNYRFQETDPFKIHFPSFVQWLQKAFKEDLPYDQIATHLIADRGDYKTKPATNWILKHLDAKEPPFEIAERTTRVFLGIQIQCARCHDHPNDRWTQEDFWATTAFFSGAKSKARQTFEGVSVKLLDTGATKVRIPETGIDVTPRFIDGRVPEDPAKAGEALASFVVGYKDRQFARALVNRLWAHFMGRGFVEPVDRFTEKSRPIHPELLDRLSTDFIKEGYGLRKLIRTIVTSRPYGAGCTAVQGASEDAFARMNLKPQNPVQLLNTLTYALNLDVFLQTIYKTFYANKALPETYRNPEVFRMYLHLFIQQLLAPSGQAPEQAKYAGSLRLALRLMNNNDLQGLIKAGWGRLGEILKEERPPEARLEDLFLTLLSRPPTAPERRGYLDHIEKRKAAAGAYEDIYWVLLNSTEFFFNH